MDCSRYSVSISRAADRARELEPVYQTTPAERLAMV